MTGSKPDGRSSMARRHRVLAQNFAADLGGLAALSHAERAMVDQAALIVLRAEGMRAELLSGNAVDNDELVRLSNAATRILVSLGIQRRKRKTGGMTLGDVWRLDQEGQHG
jgi:hypothetical protein